MMETESGSGCLMQMLMTFIIAFVGAFTGFSVSIFPPPVDNTFVEVYTFRAEASADEMAIVEDVILSRLENLLATGLIGDYEALDVSSANEIRITIIDSRLDNSTLIAALSTMGLLELVDLSALPSDVIVDGELLATITGGDEATFPVILTNQDVAAAEVIEDGFGGYAVQVDLTSKAAEVLGTFTENHVGDRLAIVIDGVILSAPVIQTRIESTAVISGNFTKDQAQAIAIQVSNPSLPMPLELVSVG